MLPAGIGYMAGYRLVTMLVGSRGRVGLVTPTPNGHLPALFGGPFHVQLGEWVFVRWIGPLECIRGFLVERRCAWVVSGRGHRKDQFRVLGSHSALRANIPRKGGPPGGRGVRGPDFFR
jgi:hypothetical protein